jgi:predicted CoA-binding protein
MKPIVVVIGASPKPERYANMAIRSLNTHGFEVIAIGMQEGRVGSIPIITEKHPTENCFAVTLYVAPAKQAAYYAYIQKLKPKRLIFNPGTENPELAELAEATGIEVVYDCTLIMLGSGTFY